MAVTQNCKIRAAIRILLTGGLVMLAMLPIVFSLSCQAPEAEPAPATEPTPTPTEEKEAVPPKEEAVVVVVVEEEKEKVTEEEPIPPKEPTPAPEPEPTPTPESEPSPTPTPTEVQISGFAFLLSTITIPVGTTVTWFNKDSVAHTVSSREGVFDSGNLSGRATFSYTFDQNGSFEYYCKIHPYMTGKIIVGEEAVSPEEETTPEVQGGNGY